MDMEMGSGSMMKMAAAPMQMESMMLRSAAPRMQMMKKSAAPRMMKKAASSESEEDVDMGGMFGDDDSDYGA